jgi:hypothetical protein
MVCSIDKQYVRSRSRRHFILHQHMFLFLTRPCVYFSQYTYGKSVSRYTMYIHKKLRHRFCGVFSKVTRSCATRQVTASSATTCNYLQLPADMQTSPICNCLQTCRQVTTSSATTCNYLQLPMQKPTDGSKQGDTAQRQRTATEQRATRGATEHHTRCRAHPIPNEQNRTQLSFSN